MESATREVVSLAFGPRSVHAASHFFSSELCQVQNLEIVEGITMSSRGKGYKRKLVPRAAFYNASGTLRPAKTLDIKEEKPQQPETRLDWNGPTASYDLRAHKTAKKKGNQKVEYWNDYAQFSMPSRYNRLVPGIHSGLSNFNFYSQGYSFLQSSETREEYTDDLRRLLEDCDYPQGVQVFADIDGGFGGMAERYLMDFRDDYQKMPLLVWTLGGNKTQKPNALQLRRKRINYALGLSRISELSSAIVPIMDSEFKPPTLDKKSRQKLKLFTLYDKSNLYHDTAALSSVISTSLLPLRLKIPSDGKLRAKSGISTTYPTRSISLSTLLQCVSPVPSNKFLSLSYALGSPENLDIGKTKEKPDRLPGKPGIITTFGSQGTIFGEFTVFQGLGEVPQIRNLKDLRTRKNPKVEDLREWQKMYQIFGKKESYYHSALSTPSPLTLHSSFPKSITYPLKLQSLPTEMGSSVNKSPRPSLAVLSHLCSTSGVASGLKDFEDELRSLQIGRASEISTQLKKDDFGHEEIKLALEGLRLSKD